MKDDAQKKYMELQMLQHQAQQVQKQIVALESQAEEMDLVENALDEFSRAKKGSHMFVTLTPGIFVKAKLEETDELLVNVGSGALVKKSIPDAKKIVAAQGAELRKLREELSGELEKISKYARKVQDDARSLVG